MNTQQPQFPLQDDPSEIDYAANLALFLVEKTGSIFNEWRGRMSAADQRELMGCYLGRGTIIINGRDETVRNRVTVRYGQDWEDRNITTFAALGVVQIEADQDSEDEDAAELFQEVPVAKLTTQRSGRRMLVCYAS